MAADEFDTPALWAPGSEPRAVSVWFWAAVAVFVVSRVYLLLAFAPLYSDVTLYFRYAVETWDFGRVPYLQEKIEYPPLAYEVMTVPRWADDNRISPAQAKRLNQTLDWDASYAAYERPFRLLMGLAEGLSFVLFALTLARLRPDLLTAGTWGYVVSTTLLAHVLYSRLDAGLLALVMLWAYAWTRLRHDSPRVWSSLAYLTVGLGISYKFVPVVTLPYLLLADWQVTGRRTSGGALARPLAYLGLGVLFPYLPLLRSSGWSALSWLHFHAERGIEIESIYATLMMVMAPWGFRIEAVHGSGCWNLVSSLAPILASASTWLLAAALLAMLLWVWCRKASYERDDAFRIACLSILVAVTLSKVFSPQYLVWAVPLLLLLAADVLDNRAFITLTCGIIFTALLTTAVFPYLFFEQGRSRLDFVDFNPYALVPNLHPLPCALLVLRNLLWMGAVVWVARATLAPLSFGARPGATSAGQRSPD